MDVSLFVSTASDFVVNYALCLWMMWLCATVATLSELPVDRFDNLSVDKTLDLTFEEYVRLSSSLQLRPGRFECVGFGIDFESMKKTAYIFISVIGLLISRKYA